MNKILCDVCGTSYPDTATHCPICSTARTDTNKTASEENTGYAYVKGGRFSHANVRKRNAGQKELPRVVAPAKPKKETNPTQKPKKPAPGKESQQQSRPSRKSAETAAQSAAPARQQSSRQSRQQNQQPESPVSNIVLIIIAVLLVIAIIAVCAYIVREYLIGDKPQNPGSGSNPTQSATTTIRGEVPCTELRVALTEHSFTTVGDAWLINVTALPENTTDVIRYESSDPRIATVDDKGHVTAVADGEVTITITCGQHVVECRVTCQVGVAPVDPSQPSDPPATDPVDPPFVLELNSDDFTLDGYGKTWDLYDGELDVTQILWTSSDETVATVTNGVVMAVGNGQAVITAEYMGQLKTCIVRCTNVVVNEYELRTIYGKGDDFTIKVGDTITLYLQDKETKLRIQASELTFSLSKEGIIKIDEKGKITALASGRVTVTVTYGELTFKALVRVSK